MRCFAFLNVLAMIGCVKYSHVAKVVFFEKYFKKIVLGIFDGFFVFFIQ